MDKIYKNDSINLEKMSKNMYKYLMYYYDKDLRFMPMKSSRENIDRWNENKYKIYQLLGNKTKIKIPFDKTLYDYVKFNTQIDLILSDAFDHSFTRINKNMSNKDIYLFNNLKEQTDLLLRMGVINIGKNDFNIQKGKYKFSKYFNLFDMKSNTPKEKIINKYSLRKGSCTLKGGNLVISIEPIDYLTIADNGYNWTSCHSPEDRNFFGNLFYMTDKITAVIYLEGTSKYDIGDVYNKKILEVPNKRMRRLVYFDTKYESVILSKIYPNDNKHFDELSIGLIQNIYNNKGLVINKNNFEIKNFVKVFNGVNFALTDSKICHNSELLCHNDAHKKISEGDMLSLYNTTTY